MTSMRNLMLTCAALLVLGIIVIYLVFDPTQCDLFPKCPFLMLTGLKCPGCGSQRVVHALLNGDVATAWHHNAFMVAMLPVMVLYVASEISRKRLNRLYRLLNSIWAVWIVFAVVMLWWILRNVFGW